MLPVLLFILITCGMCECYLEGPAIGQRCVLNIAEFSIRVSDNVSGLQRNKLHICKAGKCAADKVANVRQRIPRTDTVAKLQPVAVCLITGLSRQKRWVPRGPFRRSPPPELDGLWHG